MPRPVFDAILSVGASNDFTREKGGQDMGKRGRRALLLVAAPLLAGWISAADAALVCKPLLKGIEPIGLPGRPPAETAAIVQWSSQATALYTLRYANWGNATSRRVTCKRVTQPLGNNVYFCQAQARPCVHE